MDKSEHVAAYGDFQTPPGLAREVCALLARANVSPVSLVEPTCGVGNFLLGGLEQFECVTHAVGVDVNQDHLALAKAALRERAGASRVELIHRDFFRADWNGEIGRLPEPTLVLGNLPWVTNSRLASLGSGNVPAKTNFNGHHGLDAITGKANFDISEWMLIRLIEAMNGRRGAIAMLCKSAVARKALRHAWKNQLAIDSAAIYRIDAARHFAAAVEAVLLFVRFDPGGKGRTAGVFSSLSDETPASRIGFDGGLLIADVRAHERWKHLRAEAAMNWRSGIKHDCSRVMEFTREGDRYRNGFGEFIELEEHYIYPMLKSSALANARARRVSRFMLVTQRTVGASTDEIRKRAPRTWEYLFSRADLLDGRASSIYRGRPRFSIFGVGDYSFTRWKVAISGFYKKLEFAIVGPRGGKPTVFDDTVYFLPCESKRDAAQRAEMLNSPVAREFFSAYVFWDAKRPITAELLRSLDLRTLGKELGVEAEFGVGAFAPSRRRDQR